MIILIAVLIILFISALGPLSSFSTTWFVRMVYFIGNQPAKSVILALVLIFGTIYGIKFIQLKMMQKK